MVEADKKADVEAAVCYLVLDNGARSTVGVSRSQTTDCLPINAGDKLAHGVVDLLLGGREDIGMLLTERC